MKKINEDDLIKIIWNMQEHINVIEYDNEKMKKLLAEKDKIHEPQPI